MSPTSNNLFAGFGTRRHRTPKYEMWAKEAGWILASQRPPMFDGKVSIRLEVEEPKTKRATDLDNRTKAVLDLLVSHGVIPSDDQRYVRRIILEWADVDGVRVTIEAMP